MSSLRLVRIALLAIAIEVMAILGLVGVVAVAGPAEKSAAMRFAEETGTWFGPLAGVVLCFLGGYWVSKSLKTGQKLSGAVLGAAVAVLDIALLVLGGAEFKLLFLVSNALRVLAGYSGGLLASRGARSAA